MYIPPDPDNFVFTLFPLLMIRQITSSRSGTRTSKGYQLEKRLVIGGLGFTKLAFTRHDANSLIAVGRLAFHLTLCVDKRITFFRARLILRPAIFGYSPVTSPHSAMLKCAISPLLICLVSPSSSMSSDAKKIQVWCFPSVRLSDFPREWHLVKH